MLMVVAGVIPLAEWGAGKHARVGTEAKEEECDEESDQNHGCYTLGEEYLVCWGGFGGGEHVRYRGDSEQNEDDHH